MSDERASSPSIKVIVCFALAPFVVVPAVASLGATGEYEFALFALLPWLAAFCLAAVRTWRRACA
jgi:hypothetical protein